MAEAALAAAQAVLDLHARAYSDRWTGAAEAEGSAVKEEDETEPPQIAVEPTRAKGGRSGLAVTLVRDGGGGAGGGPGRAGPARVFGEIQGGQRWPAGLNAGRR